MITRDFKSQHLALGITNKHLMNSKCLFIAFMLEAVIVTAQVPISSEATNALYDRIESQHNTQVIASPDGKLKALYRQTHPGVYGHNPGKISIINKGGKVVASHLLIDNGGRLVAVAHWSPDSQFCVFTTISSGGHSPWQFGPYVFSTANGTFRFLGDSFYTVIDPEFHFGPPSTVFFVTRQGAIPLKLNEDNQ